MPSIQSNMAGINPQIMEKVSKAAVAPPGQNPLLTIPENSFTKGMGNVPTMPSMTSAPGQLAEMPVKPIGMEARGHTSYMSQPPSVMPGVTEVGEGFKPSPIVPTAPLSVPGSAPFKMPQGPGTKMFNALTLQHMAATTPGISSSTPSMQNVYTRQPEAMKVAIQALGIQGPNNPNGLAIDMDTAKELWFGSKDAKVSSADETAFRAIAQAGDQKIDKKLIKQYVNYDGSTTWEILNTDKSIKSRFTLGSSEGKKIFAQGGYNEYASELGAITQKVGADSEMAKKFEATRKNLMGV